MKTVEITKEVKSYKYEAVDGVQFDDREECIKYENSAKCVLLTKYNELIVKHEISEYSICDFGSEDYAMDIIKLRNEKDIDIVMQLYALYNPHDSYRKYDKVNKEKCIKALKENDFIFIGRNDCCGDDVFRIEFSRNDLINGINKLCDETN